MSSISLKKFGQNLPVTSVVAFSQAAVGFGVGLLLADKLGRTARHRTAIALIGAGTATIIPFVAGVIANVNSRPESSREMKRRLASIRQDTGLSTDDETY
jgi:gas vesicle protein